MDKPIRRIAYAVLATVSGLVLLFSYRTSTGAEIPTTDAVAGSSSTAPGSPEAGTSDTGTSTPQSGSTSSTTPSDTPTDSTASGASDLQDGTYTGDAAATRYGPVQVRISVSGGQIASVDVVDYPTDSPRDRQINQQAVPMLVGETTSAQSAEIDLISGATYTSRGYTQSLQSAIDQAQQ